MTKVRSASDIATQRITQLSEAAVNKHRHSIFPIYGLSRRNTPDHIGTAVALDLQDQKLLLTAGHLIDQHEHTDLYVGGTKLTPLNTHFLTSRSPDRNRNSDHYDFAIGRLSNETIEALRGLTFLSDSDVCPQAETRSGPPSRSPGTPTPRTRAFKSQRIRRALSFTIIPMLEDQILSLTTIRTIRKRRTSSSTIRSAPGTPEAVVSTRFSSKE